MNANEPAFPGKKIEYSGTYGQSVTTPGLSKREYFAAVALSGLCAAGALQLPTDCPYVAEKCVKIADELLKQLQS